MSGQGRVCLRLPALYPAKKRWRLSEQSDPRNYLEPGEHSQHVEDDTMLHWMLSQTRFLAVLEDQATRDQVIKVTEHEAPRRYPDLVVASLGAQRKDKLRGSRISPGTF